MKGAYMQEYGVNEKKNNYVMFQNAGTADFYALFLVGFTDKAGDPNAIGMFGSGFKLAITASLRMGIETVLFLGREKVTFKKAPRKVKGENIEQLVFVCESSEGEVKEFQTNLTLGYGAKDWKKPWVVFREIMANCRDADPHGYEVVAGIEPRGREGFTRVFVEATDEIMEIYRNLDFYFKEERHAIFSCDDGRIYPKHGDEGETNYYCKGMFVLSTHEKSLYDFDLTRMPINESRDASKENLSFHILRLYDMCPVDIKAEVLRFIIENSEMGIQTLEGSLYLTQSNRPLSWADAFRHAFPDFVICTFSEIEYQGMVRLGRKAVRAGRELYRMLSSHGIMTAEKILRDEQNLLSENFQPQEDLKETFNRAFEIVAAKLPEVNMLNVSFVRLPPAEQNVTYVSHNRARGEYKFTETLLKSGVKAIGSALIDALAQTKSGRGKCDMSYECELIKAAWDCLTAGPVPDGERKQL
jgi:hypothetical protein